MGAAAGLDILLTLLDHLSAWGAVVAQAQAEGRDVTPAEVEAFFVADTAAGKRLADAIARAKAEGR